MWEAVASEGDDEVDDAESQQEEPFFAEVAPTAFWHGPFVLTQESAGEDEDRSKTGNDLVKSSQCQGGKAKASDARYAIQRKKRQTANRAVHAWIDGSS